MGVMGKIQLVGRETAVARGHQLCLTDTISNLFCISNEVTSFSMGAIVTGNFQNRAPYLDKSMTRAYYACSWCG